MDALKKRIIRNGLASKEFYNLGEKYKHEIQVMAEEVLSRYKFDVTVVTKLKSKKK